MIENFLNTLIVKYHQRRGLHFLNLSRYKKAILHFEKALLLNDSVENFFYFSICLIALNKHQEAISYLERIMDRQTEDILISSSLMECYLVVREWEKGERLANYLAEKFPTNTFVQKLKSIIIDPIKREKYATAKESFFTAVDFIEKKEYDAAFEAIKTAIDLDESNAAYYYLAGTILLKPHPRRMSGDAAWKVAFPVQDHLYYFEKAVLLAPQNESYKRHLQYLKTKKLRIMN